MFFETLKLINSSRLSWLPYGVLMGVMLFGNISSARAQLTGISEIGHSYQADARGGTETSIGDTGLAHIRQPASAATQAYAKFDSKINSVFINNQWSDIKDTGNSDVNYALSYNLGTVIPLSEDFGLGLAYETGGANSKFANRYNFPDLTNPMFNSFTYNTKSIYANLGYKVTEKLFVGGGPTLQILDLGMNLNAGPGVLNVPTTQGVGGGFQLGVLYQITEIFRLGASYASSTYYGNMNFGETSYVVPGVNPLTAPLGIESFTTPGRISFGVSAKASEKMKVAVEAGYLNYGSSVLGGMNFQGLINNNLNLGFQDFWVLNTGIEYEFTEYINGAIGYVFNTQPINASEMVPIAASVGQSQFTYGLRYKGERFWAGFAHMITLTSDLSSNSSTHRELGPDYQRSTVRQALQGLSCGAGFKF